MATKNLLRARVTRRSPKALERYTHPESPPTYSAPLTPSSHVSDASYVPEEQSSLGSNMSEADDEADEGMITRSQKRKLPDEKPEHINKRFK